MWKPKYPLENNIRKIEDHNHLPPGAIELARLQDGVSLQKDLWIFVKNEGMLSILTPFVLKPKNVPPEYMCPQYDFPLEALAWFPLALTGFREGKGGGGIMSSADHNVDGEMLAVITLMGIDDGRGGYSIENKSRCDRDVAEEDINTYYEPHKASWPTRFLYEGGLMDLLKDLAKRYEDGKI